MKHRTFFQVLVMLLSISLEPGTSTAGVEMESGQNAASAAAGLLQINNLAVWTRADGMTAFNPYTGPNNSQLPWGAIYPANTPAGLVYIDGMVWGGMVHDGEEPVLRVGGSTWLSGLQPGAILSPGVAEDPAGAAVNRVWRYRPDWRSADLHAEAFTLLASRPDAALRRYQFSEVELKAAADSLRTAYERDRREWPWQKGAPYYDTNGNGLMDGDEEPGLLKAGQVVWFVANDLDPQRTREFYGSPPAGLEVQVTLWGYGQEAGLENTVFRRLRLIYKGTRTAPAGAAIDSMAIGLYSDIDIGSYDDDMAGTDTTLQMIYGYNATTLDTTYKKFALSPPALGYSLLYGPRVPASGPGDFAVAGFRKISRFRNLPMTMSWVDRTGDTDTQPTVGSYDGTRQYYNVLCGFRPRPVNPPDRFRVPATGVPVRFSMTGDPVAGTGWLDDFPGDRQITCSSGHFRMALGDTQEVVLIMTAAQGADRLASVAAMKFFTRKAREYAGYMFVTHVGEAKESGMPGVFRLGQNYPNPFNAGTMVPFELEQAALTRLAIFDLAGRRVTTLVNEMRPAGRQAVRWEGVDSQGVRQPSGLYWFRLEAGGRVETRKLLLLR